MVISTYLAFLISLWFSVQLACTVTMSSPDIAPLPTNVKVALYPSIINVTWECNITKAMEDYRYSITFEGYQIDFDVHKCVWEYNIHTNEPFILHKGLSIDFITKKGNKPVKNNWTVVTFTPEGKNHSAAEDLSCVIYNVYIMNCSWSVGKEAPEDVQYHMDLWQEDENFTTCMNYRNDTFGRQVGCYLEAKVFDFHHKVYVSVSSKQTTVQFTDAIFKPYDLVILDPPGNIHLSYKSTGLEIAWERPITHNEVQDHCFLYNVYFKEKGGISRDTTETYFKTELFQPSEKVTVTLRVKWESQCSDNKQWSAWSDSHTLGSDHIGFVQNHLLLVLGIGTAVVLILVIFLCHRFRLWSKLFPKVPKPAMKIFDKVEQIEIKDQKLPECGFPFSNKEEEECVCSNITETS